MRAIRINVKGFLNSFRDPYFIDYHRTLLFPPKTTIVGLVVNVMGLNENNFYELQDKILVGIILESFKSKGFDLWRVRKGKLRVEEPVTQPIHREFLVEPRYTIYISSNADLLDKIETSLKMPRRYYNLGRDDEFISIDRKEIKSIELMENKKKEFRCILPFDIYEYNYTQKIYRNPIIPPEVVKLPLMFEKTVSGRTGKKISKFTQFCGIKVTLEKELASKEYYKIAEDREAEENIAIF